MGYILILFIMLGILVVYVILNTTKGKGTKSNLIENQNSEYKNLNNGSTAKIFPNKTKEIIEKEADEKYIRISDKKKQEHLLNRKRFLKQLYISLSCSFFLLSLCVLFTTLEAKQVDIFNIIISILLFVVGVTLLIVLYMKLKQDDKSLILEELQKVLKKNYNSLTEQKVAQYTSYVKEHSPMYLNIVHLNSQYNFDRSTCRVRYYQEYLNSKRQLDNFNYSKWINLKVDEIPQFFNNFESIYKSNIKMYKEYSEKYEKLKDLRKEIDIEDLTLDYETFNYIENEIFNQSKLEDITKPCISLEISYTSPSGRNYYSENHMYSYSELVKLKKDKQEQEEQLLLEKQRKEKLSEKKRAKEKKLRELDKIEKQLTEKENEIKRKEKEFLEATKEHIYTSDSVDIANSENEIDENMTISQKMNILREKFNNGEITYDEYQAKRKELM